MQKSRSGDNEIVSAITNSEPCYGNQSTAAQLRPGRKKITRRMVSRRFHVHSKKF